MITKRQMKIFLTTLEGPKGCNFRKDANGKTIWKCNANASKPIAHRILRSMGVSPANIKEVIDVAERPANGGGCDCEIIMNAKRGLMRAAK